MTTLKSYDIFPSNLPTEFELKAASIGMNKLLYGTNFYVSDVTDIAKVLKKNVQGPDYDALRVLHCMKWADMPEDFREEVRMKVITLLGFDKTIKVKAVERKTSSEYQNTFADVKVKEPVKEKRSFMGISWIKS